MNILIIVLDSLRYDVAVETNTPNINNLIKMYQSYSDKWVKVYAQATYTLPAHVSMLNGGMFPCDYHLPEPYGRNQALFSVEGKTKRTGIFKMKRPSGICSYFATKGFKTIGIGGVSWFNPENENSTFWKGMFHEYYWMPCFSENYLDGFRQQIELLKNIEFLENNFIFINVSATHEPFMEYGNSKKGQGKALQYVDKYINNLLHLVTTPVKMIITSDHGNCFGEDGMWGRGFYHEKIMEVPMAYLEIP